MALITGLGLFFVAVLTAALSRTIVEEIEAWTPSIIRSLIKLAVGRLPERQRERFDEEWRSHVSEVPGRVGKLLVAVGFLFAAFNIVLTGRRNQVLETLSRRVAQLDEVHSTTALVVRLIQNDETLPLALREGLLPHVNELSSHLSQSQARRNELAAHIAVASATPRTLVGDLLYTLRGSAIIRFDEQIAHQAAQIMESATKIVKAMEERKQA